MPTNGRVPKVALAIWALGSLFFFVEYFIRVSASVLGDTFKTTFAASGVELGIMFGCFYYTYILMQLPVGMLMDRYKPRHLMMLASLVCAVGCFLFAGMVNMPMGYAGRLLMGFSAAFAFVGTLKMISIWFNPRQFAVFAGLTQALGMLGAYVGDAPMSWVFHQVGWRLAIVGFGVLLVLLFLGFWAVKKTQANGPASPLLASEKLPIKDGLKAVLTNPMTWYNCFFISMLYGPTTIFSEQWGPMFMKQLLGVHSFEASSAIGASFIGLAIGCPLLGWLSDRWQKRVPVMRLSAILSALFLILVIYGNRLGVAMSVPTETVLLFCYGVANGGIVPSYTYAAEINARKVSGLALGVANMASVILGGVLSPVVGYLLELFSGKGLSAHAHFSTGDFQQAFLVLPLCFVLGIGVSFLLKETHCQAR